MKRFENGFERNSKNKNHRKTRQRNGSVQMHLRETVYENVEKFNSSLQSMHDLSTNFLVFFLLDIR